MLQLHLKGKAKWHVVTSTSSRDGTIFYKTKCGHKFSHSPHKLRRFSTDNITLRDKLPCRSQCINCRATFTDIYKSLARGGNIVAWDGKPPKNVTEISHANGKRDGCPNVKRDTPQSVTRSADSLDEEMWDSFREAEQSVWPKSEYEVADNARNAALRENPNDQMRALAAAVDAVLAFRQSQSVTEKVPVIGLDAANEDTPLTTEERAFLLLRQIVQNDKAGYLFSGAMVRQAYDIVGITMHPERQS